MFIVCLSRAPLVGYVESLCSAERPHQGPLAFFLEMVGLGAGQAVLELLVARLGEES